MNAVEILLSDARGVYIPANFVDEFDVTQWGLDPESWAVQTLANEGECSEHYWDAWIEILDKAEYRKDGNVWRLYQDGDLFALCHELMTDEEKQGFGFED